MKAGWRISVGGWRSTPGWLPARVGRVVDQMRIEAATEAITRSDPVEVAGARDEAEVDVHMLVCRRDVRLAMVALKSLLRYVEGRWSVSWSDDGSLGAHERGMLSAHFPGSRWLDWPGTGEVGLTDRWALLRGYYLDRHRPLMRKLLHPMLGARCDRVVVLDPDTAFFERPARLLEWANGADGVNLYLHDDQDEARVIDGETGSLLARWREAMAGRGRRWGVGHGLFNSGLLAFRRGTLDLDVGEAHLRWLAGRAEGEFTEGRAGIWFGGWTYEQSCYHAMLAVSDAPASGLGRAYHLGGGEGYVFNHFLRHYLVRQRTLERLRGLSMELAVLAGRVQANSGMDCSRVGRGTS